MGSDQPKRFRNLASTIGILILLAGVLGFYYLKYVPERRTEFNRNAFLELGQIQTALQSKSQAYWDAFHSIIPKEKIDPLMLAAFNYKPAEGESIDADDEIQPSHFELNDTTRRWDMVYNVYDNRIKKHPKLVSTLSKDVDTLVGRLISTYRDIFDGYLLICKVRSAHASSVPNKKNGDMPDTMKAKIIYHSDDLSTEYLVNPDSLLQKNEGVSTMNILDVTIAGNPYKLFLYPFEMGKQKLTLIGLISDTNYREANQKIPFTFFTVFLVLLLLLAIHLPILRIYVLGPDERIRGTDIRLIIGSYFVAAFFGFFLFTKIFLDEEQIIQNKKHLNTLALNITNNFYSELDSINRQLSSFDDTLDNVQRNKSQLLWSMSNIPSKNDIAALNDLFKPRIYPYSTGVFWINDDGHWVARWASRYTQTKSKMIDVKDRSYYTDFKTGKTYSIPGIIDTFTIQPTLSKMEGEYIITVAKKSTIQSYTCRNGNKTKKIDPHFIGLSSKMHSVSNVIMPPGYGFSIIDVRGKILFDSKEGRPLLSNILKEVENPDGIQQTAIYRNRRYFAHLLLRSKNSSLLSTPVNGTPYQLLVYYNHFRSDGFEEHLVALSAGLMGVVICMVLFSALINQWAKTKNRMLESRSPQFEWLHPSGDPLKQRYYRHLVIWMVLLFVIYLMAWFIMDSRLRGSEFSMLFISLLFPFYIALHYYELRERYYDVHEHRTGIAWYFSRPSLALRCHILFIVIIINSFVPFYKLSKSTALPVLITQLAWVVAIIVSSLWFRKYLKGDKITGIPACMDMATKKESPKIQHKIPVSYIWAILTGVALISVIPASGVFWLFFREETGLYQNADQLMIANRINQRRLEINDYLKDYKFTGTNVTDQANISALKFSHGIYTIAGWPQANDTGLIYSHVQYPSNDYIHLHELMIPDDSIAWIEPFDAAADSSWYFGKDTVKTNAGPALVYLDRRDIINPNSFHLNADPTASWNTAGLLVHSFSGDGPTFPIFFIVGLGLSLTIAYFLTLSLSKRIFLTELQLVTRHVYIKTNLADKTFELSKVRRPVKLILLQTCKQLRNTVSGNENPDMPMYFSGLPGLENIYHFEKKLPMSMLEAKMPSLISTLEPVYSELWNGLSPRQKFILFDFAQDGFANYKAGRDLQALMEKGILFFDELRLSVMTLSFQEYVLQQKDDKELREFFEGNTKENTWRKFRTPILILLAAVGIFVFVTQDAVYQKITGLLTSLTSLLPLLTNMFNKQAAAKGTGN